MDKLPTETLDHIASMVPSESQHVILQLSRCWYASSFTWAYQDIVLRDHAAFNAASEFWTDVVDTSSHQHHPDEWKILAVGRKRMLGTPRSVTIGKFVRDRNHHRTGAIYKDKELCRDVPAIFDMLQHFPRLTKITIRVVPFPVVELLDILTSIRQLQSLEIDAGCLEYTPGRLGRRVVIPTALPQSLSHLTLLGMHVAVLSPIQWEAVMLLANLSGLRRLEFDVTSWNAFYDMWRTRRVANRCRLSWLSWSGSRTPILLRDIRSLDTFVLLRSSCGVYREETYALSAIGEYLRGASQSMRFLVMPSSSQSLAGREFNWSEFHVLDHYRGSRRDFDNIQLSRERYWSSIEFSEVDVLPVFNVVTPAQFRHLLNLVATLQHERDMALIMCACPALTCLRVKLLAGDLTGLCDQNSITGVRIALSIISDLHVVFWEDVGRSLAYRTFDTWLVVMPPEMVSVKFSHSGGQFELAWRRLTHITSNKWVEFIQ
ncbi:hypothetical protein AAF712_012380 [Marasmius tenuissimus]|uniref:F-box domain-containing protein n=1 Tax=Marasmius tenuissimus TaxID=585030 RepID=A0ABR2ZIP0_9AGAR